MPMHGFLLPLPLVLHRRFFLELAKAHGVRSPFPLTKNVAVRVFRLIPGPFGGQSQIVLVVLHNAARFFSMRFHFGAESLEQRPLSLDERLSPDQGFVCVPGSPFPAPTPAVEKLRLEKHLLARSIIDTQLFVMVNERVIVTYNLEELLYLRIVEKSTMLSFCTTSRFPVTADGSGFGSEFSVYFVSFKFR